jgi:hypothetical protein
VDELRAAVSDLTTRPSAERADALVTRLHREPASPEVAAFICEALELSALHEVRDSMGMTLRWRLVDRLLALGFPHALNLSPEDLAYHRSYSARLPRAAAAMTTLLAAGSMLWSSGWLLLGASTLALNPFNFSLWVALAALLAAVVHGALAVGASFAVATGRPAPRLKLLAYLFFLGPGVAGLSELLDPGGNAGAAALIIGAPAMLTAAACAVTGALASRGTTGTVPAISGDGSISSPERGPTMTSTSSERDRAE